MKRHVPCDSFVMRDSVTTMAVYRGRAAPDKESHVRSDAGLHYANGSWARRALGSRQPRSTNSSARTSGGVVERWAEARAPRVRDGTDEGLLLNRAHTKSLSFRPASRNPRDRVRSRIQARWIVGTRGRDSRLPKDVTFAARIAKMPGANAEKERFTLQRAVTTASWPARRASEPRTLSPTHARSSPNPIGLERVRERDSA
jgi:hypothetical protein